MIRPGEQTFADERRKPSATLRTALVWILLAGAIAALLDILLTELTEMWVMSPGEEDFSMPSSLMLILQPIVNLRTTYSILGQEFIELYGWLWLKSGLFYFAANTVYHIANFIFEETSGWHRAIAKGLLSPASFIVKVGMYHCIVTFWGGRGQFGRYAYLFATITVPMTLLHSFLDFLPLAAARFVAVLPGSSVMAGQKWYYSLSSDASFAVSLILLVYTLILYYFSTKVEHGLPWWRTVIGVVISCLVVFVFWTVWPYGFSGIWAAARMLRS